MKPVLFASIFWCLSILSAHAATLIWDAQLDSNPLTVERSATETGAYTAVATVPGGTTSYILTPGAYGWYRVRNSAGPSNVVRFSLDLYTGLVTDRLDALDIRVTETVRRIEAIEAEEALERATTQPPPAPTSNLTVRQIDADHIEITCNGIGISTTGSGTRRLMECRH